MMCHSHGTRELIKTNVKGIMSAYDNALFFWHDTTGNLMGILAMLVDDFIFCGNDLFQKNVISELKKYSKLECMKVGQLNFGDFYQSKSICFIYIYGLIPTKITLKQN